MRRYETQVKRGYRVELDLTNEQITACRQHVGIDLGSKQLATVSDGRVFENPKALRANLKRLRRLSRSHSRKIKGSTNRKKAQRKLARQHARIANIRRDALHKATSTLVAKTRPESERPACIVLEDLNVSGMLKNRKLSRAIADDGQGSSGTGEEPVCNYPSGSRNSTLCTACP